MFFNDVRGVSVFATSLHAFARNRELGLVDGISGIGSVCPVKDGMDPDQLSKAFVAHYYSTFDSNTPNLLGLFQESSMLSFEGEKIQGAQNISNKLSSLPFQQCKHDISTVDC